MHKTPTILSLFLALSFVPATSKTGWGAEVLRVHHYHYGYADFGSGVVATFEQTPEGLWVNRLIDSKPPFSGSPGSSCESYLMIHQAPSLNAQVRRKSLTNEESVRELSASRNWPDNALKFIEIADSDEIEQGAGLFYQPLATVGLFAALVQPVAYAQSQAPAPIDLTRYKMPLQHTTGLSIDPSLYPVPFELVRGLNRGSEKNLRSLVTAALASATSHTLAIQKPLSDAWLFAHTIDEDERVPHKKLYLQMGFKPHEQIGPKEYVLRAKLTDLLTAYPLQSEFARVSLLTRLAPAKISDATAVSLLDELDTWQLGDHHLRWLPVSGTGGSSVENPITISDYASIRWVQIRARIGRLGVNDTGAINQAIDALKQLEPKLHDEFNTGGAYMPAYGMTASSFALEGAARIQDVDPSIVITNLSSATDPLERARAWKSALIATYKKVALALIEAGIADPNRYLFENGIRFKLLVPGLQSYFDSTLPGVGTLDPEDTYWISPERYAARGLSVTVGEVLRLMREDAELAARAVFDPDSRLPLQRRLARPGRF